MGGLLALGLAVLPATAAWADTAGSNWWFDWYDVGSAQASGATGEGVTIAVIDGQINTTLPVFQGADITVEPGLCGTSSDTTQVTEGSAHGSDVTALLIGNGTGTGRVRGIAPKSHVLFYGNADGAALGCVKTIGGVKYSDFGFGILQAIKDGARIISISQADTHHQPGDVTAIATAIAKGVVIVSADGNDYSLAKDGAFPNSANGVVATNAIKPDSSLQTQDDGQTIGWKDTTVVAPGWDFPEQAGDGRHWGDSTFAARGGSLSTPLVAGMLAVTLQKYPKATGNQLIQSLIHNTLATDHPLDYEPDSGYGYGPASLSHLLRVDPTQYPDTNPLMDKAGGIGVPTAADVAKAAAGRSTTPTGPTTDPAHPIGSIVGPVLIGGAIVLLVVIVGVVLLVVLLARRSRARRGGA